MNAEHAAHIIEQLALGTDPRNGAPLAPEDACTSPEVIRALFIARNALQGKPATDPERPARRGPVVRNGVVLANVGKKWSSEDVDTLLEHFAAGTSIRDLSRQLGRTDAGIVARLVHAGALPDRDTGYALIMARRERAAEPAQ
jgi:hypothetical protein